MPAKVCTICSGPIEEPELATGADEICATCAGADDGGITEAEATFTALLDAARTYMAASGCDADTTAELLAENLS